MTVIIMKKEIIVAIIIGFFIGAAAAWSMTHLPKLLNGIKIQTSTKPPSPAISQIQNTSISPDIKIDSPKDESVSDSKSIDVTGSIARGNTILIESLDNQITTQASDSGSFSSKVSLREGANTIYLTVYDQSGNSNTKSLNIYYTTEKL